MQAEAQVSEVPPTLEAVAGEGSARRPWGPWSGLLGTVLVVVVAGAATFGLYRSGLVPSRVGPGDSLGLGLLLAWQALVVILTVLLSLRGGRPVANLSLGPPVDGIKSYIVAIAAVVGFGVVVTGLEYTFARDVMANDLRPILELARGPLWWLGLIVVAVGAPLSEELLFRGFLLPALAASRIGFIGATLVSSALWTSLHLSYSWVGLSEIFLVGLLFSWLLWRTQSLRVTILCHALYNAVLLLGLRYLSLAQ